MKRGELDYPVPANLAFFLTSCNLKALSQIFKAPYPDRMAGLLPGTIRWRKLRHNCLILFQDKIEKSGDHWCLEFFCD